MTARDRVLMILRTDPHDVGCEQFFELLDEYVDLVLAGEDPEVRLPGMRAHLDACGPCVEDYRGLYEALGGADG